ncbi:unnamed protein product [Cuscuta epithymum]|uniref:LOB domain-containing protein n=1 Tax=Cuscuta epithymum TaxID=186058 RepID=A0AAV0EQB2_9ASTE|nr:unnamed protein product [Cuscuta epithymum]
MPGGSSSSSSSSSACAACKYQRRKCAPDCVLAPYFPANQPRTFQNAHRLFGISNMTKLLKQLENDEDLKADAMKSIIFEADMRDRFPVYGCVEYIYYLDQQIKQAADELRCVYAQLAFYREQSLLGPVDSENENQHQLQYTADSLHHYYGIVNNNSADVSSRHPMKVNMFGDIDEEDLGEEGDQDQSSESVGKPNFFSLQQCYNRNDNRISISPFPDEAGLHHFNSTEAIVHDRQSYIETKDTRNMSSSESSLFIKGDEKLCKNELRYAASYFSLTS